MATQAFRTITFLITTFIFATAAQAKPDEASDAQVQNCQPLGEVTGSSGYGKNTGWKSTAKVKAEQKANAIGATHIVWSDFRPVGAFNGEAVARAYTCHR